MTRRLIALLLATTPVLIAAQPAPPAVPAQVLQGTVAQAGLIPVNVDRRQGRIIVSLPVPDAVWLGQAKRKDGVVMVWLLIAVPCIVAALVAASIQLKSSVRRQTLPEAAHYAGTPYASALTWRRHLRQKV